MMLTPFLIYIVLTCACTFVDTTTTTTTTTAATTPNDNLFLKALEPEAVRTLQILPGDKTDKPSSEPTQLDEKTTYPPTQSGGVIPPSRTTRTFDPTTISEASGSSGASSSKDDFFTTTAGGFTIAFMVIALVVVLGVAVYYYYWTLSKVKSKSDIESDEKRKAWAKQYRDDSECSDVGGAPSSIFDRTSEMPQMKTPLIN